MVAFRCRAAGEVRGVPSCEIVHVAGPAPVARQLQERCHARCTLGGVCQRCAVLARDLVGLGAELLAVALEQELQQRVAALVDR
jgi:hypothetical protein